MNGKKPTVRLLRLMLGEGIEVSILVKPKGAYEVKISGQKLSHLTYRMLIALGGITWVQGLLNPWANLFMLAGTFVAFKAAGRLDRWSRKPLKPTSTASQHP